MSKASILSTIRGLKKPQQIRIDPVQSQPTVKQTGPGEITIGEEITTPLAPKADGSLEGGLSFNNLEAEHPDAFKAFSDTPEGKELGVENLINKLAQATQDEQDVVSRALLTGDTAEPVISRKKGASRPASPAFTLSNTTGLAKQEVLKPYLNKLGISTARHSAGEKLLNEAKKGTGLGDEIASKRLRSIQSEQILKDTAVDNQTKLRNYITQSFEDVGIISRQGSGIGEAATILNKLSTKDKFKAADTILETLQPMVTGDTLPARTTTMQAVGKRLARALKLERPADGLKGVEAFQAQKNFEVNLAAAGLDRLVRDGDAGMLTSKFNARTAGQKNEYSRLVEANDLLKAKEYNKIDPKLIWKNPNNGKVEFKPEVKTQYKAYKDKVSSGNWESWELGPTDSLEGQMFKDTLKSYENHTGSGNAPIFGNKPPKTNSKNLLNTITTKQDLPEDLEHFAKISDDSVFMKSINTLQSVKLDVDMDIVSEIEELAKKAGQGIVPRVRDDVYVDLTSRKERANQLGDYQKAEDINERIKGEQKKDKVKLDNMDTSVTLAKQYADRGGFYLPTWVDSRGRVGYKPGINPQKDKPTAAMLILADEHKVPMDAKWEKDIINEALSYYPPTSKFTPSERLKWWNDNLNTEAQELIDWGGDWTGNYDNYKSMVDGKDAFAMLKPLKELHRKYRLGATKSGHLTGLDAVTSQAQMVAAAFKDNELAKFTGLTAEVAENDLYRTLGNDVWKEIDNTVANVKANHGHSDVNRLDNVLTPDEKNAIYWADPRVKQHLRKVMKRPVMTRAYNAGKRTIAKALLSDAGDFPKADDITNPLYQLNDEKANYIVKILFDKFKTNPAYAPVNQLQEIAGNAAKKLVKDTGQKKLWKGTEYPIYEYNYKPGDSFKSKSGFTFRQHYASSAGAQVKTSWHSPKFNRETQQLTDPTWDRATFGFRSPLENPKNDAIDKLVTSFAPNLIHSLDADVLHHTVKYLGDRKIPIVTTHDQFAVPAGYSDELRAAYVFALKEVFKGNRIKEILEQLLPKKVVDEAMEGTTYGDLDLNSLDDLIKDYWNTGIAPIDVG